MARKSAARSSSTPAKGEAVVLDGFRYIVEAHHDDGTTLLVPAPRAGHDRRTLVRTDELVRDDAAGALTLPGRAAAGPALGEPRAQIS